MMRALSLARIAYEQGEVPVGAVLVQRGIIVAEAHNETIASGNPMRHAEMVVMERGCEYLKNDSTAHRLMGCDLYVTLEPCAMCAGAISWTRLNRLYFGAYDPKSGAVDHGPRIFTHDTCHHIPDIYGGLGEGESADLLKSFFADRRLTF